MSEEDRVDEYDDEGEWTDRHQDSLHWGDIEETQNVDHTL